MLPAVITFHYVIVDEFFKDGPDKPYSASRSRSLEQSPCYPIIGAKLAGRHIMYYALIVKIKSNEDVNAGLAIISILPNFDECDLLNETHNDFC